MKILILFISFFLMLSSFGQGLISTDLNFSSFKPIKPKLITSELSEITSESFKLNPEYGILPIDVPCENCIELIHLRTDSTRQYKKGNQVYFQKGNCSINYVDGNGYFRENNR